MKVYHTSRTLQPQDTLQPDHERLAAYTQPFVQALARSEDCFYAMLLQGKYLYAVFRRSRLPAEWVNYAKWATEAVFEHVRRRQFPACVSRLCCSYFYASLENARRLLIDDWGCDPQEAVHVHMYEMELDDPAPQTFDMNLYDRAYQAIEDEQDVPAALEYARRYFAGEHTESPVWEVLSDKPAVLTQDMTAQARQWLQQAQNGD